MSVKKIYVELVVEGDQEAALTAIERALDDAIPGVIEYAADGTDDAGRFEVLSGRAFPSLYKLTTAPEQT